MRNRVLFALTVALFVPVGAAEGQGAQVEGTAAGVQGKGSGAFMGPLRALQLASANSEAPPADGWFELSAASLLVETDVYDYEAYGVTVTQMTPHMERLAPSGNAQILGTEKRSRHMLTVFPTSEGSAQVQTSLPGDAIVPSNGTAIAVGWSEMYTRAPTSLATAGGLRWQGTGSLSVTGDFVVVLWDWDGTLVEADGTESAIQTGTFPEATMLGLPDEAQIVARKGEMRQAYVYVEQGTLAVQQDVASLPANVHTADGTLEMDGLLSLTGVLARFTAGGLAPVNARSMTLDGKTEILLEPVAADRIPFQAVPRGPTKLQADGVTLSTISPTPAASPPWALWGLGAMFLLVGLALAMRRIHQARQDRILSRAESLLDAEEFALAAAMARKVRNSSRLGEEAIVVEVESYLQAGDWQAADPLLNGPHWAARSEGVRLYLLARCLVLAGRIPAATEALRRSLSASPDLRAQILLDPGLQSLAPSRFGEGYA